MPIFRNKSKLIFFSHIPKCGGSSVEKYAAESGLKLGLIDYAFRSREAEVTWNITSPQHIDGASTSTLFTPSFFDAYFAVVRHPISRLQSAFKHQKFSAKTIQTGDSLSEFVKQELTANAMTIGYCDNHFLPQTKFIIPKCTYKIFKLESGLARVKSYIDAEFFNEQQTLKIAHANKGKADQYTQNLDLSLDSEAKDIVADIYQKDFKKFGYSID